MLKGNKERWETLCALAERFPRAFWFGWAVCVPGMIRKIMRRAVRDGIEKIG